jgi:hypothetical protein
MYLALFLAVIVADIVGGFVIGYVPYIDLPFGLGTSIVSAIIVIVLFVIFEKIGL